MEQKKIIYIGESDALPISAEQLKEELSCKLKQISFTENFQEMIEELLANPSDLILLQIKFVNDQILNFLLMIKSHHQLKRSRLVAIFPDKNLLEVYQDIFSFGVEYAFISSEENARVISDISCIISSEQAESIKYATADRLDIPADVEYSAKVSHVSTDKVYLETSFPLVSDSDLKGQLNLQGLTGVFDFKVRNSGTFIPRSFFEGSIELDLVDKTIDLSSIQDSFSRNDRALIIDHRVKTMTELMAEMNVNNRYIKLCSRFLDFENKIETFKPEIICFQMTPEEEDAQDDDKKRVNGLFTFNKMINKVKSLAGYNPYILVFGEGSRSKAFQKAHNYDRILVNRESFKLSYLNMVIDGFQKHVSAPENVKFLKPPSKETYFGIRDEIIITSLSENSVTFLTKRKIRQFTSFKISDPLNIFVTAVPFDSSLESKRSYYHYSGLISCTNEEDKMMLRRLVNMLIELEMKDHERLVLKSVSELREDVIKKKAKELADLRSEQKKNIETEGFEE